MIHANRESDMIPSVVSLKTLKEIIPQYDFFIFDLWGVIHNGKQAFPGAIAILNHLKDIGKPVYFLSNAPRRLEAAMHQLIERGVPRDLYQGIFTSGEDCFEHLRDRPDDYYKNLGQKLYHLGPDKDKNLYTDLSDYESVTLHDADFILNTGTHTFDDTVEDYIEELQIGINRKLPMICANPDLGVIYGDGEAICAGRLGKEYEKMGGEVRYHGKPSKEIYEKLCARVGVVDKTKALMIGDSLRTDIKGANNAEIDCVFILSGIHKLDTAESAAAFYAPYDAMPTYVMERVE